MLRCADSLDQLHIVRYVFTLEPAVQSRRPCFDPEQSYSTQDISYKFSFVLKRTDHPPRLFLFRYKIYFQEKTKKQSQSTPGVVDVIFRIVWTNLYRTAKER